MIGINKALSSDSLAKLELFKVIFPDWKVWAWRILEEMEAVSGEQAIYTWSWKTRVWGLPVPVSFTLRVKHLRWVLTHFVGEKP